MLGAQTIGWAECGVCVDVGAPNTRAFLGRRGVLERGGATLGACQLACNFSVRLYCGRGRVNAITLTTAAAVRVWDTAAGSQR